MNRRRFLKTAVTGAAGASLAGAGALATSFPTDTAPEFYEYRRYRLAPGASSDLLQSYLRLAFIPAVHRRGGGPVGVFTQSDPASADVHVVVRYPNLAAFTSVAAGIDTSAEVRAAVPEYFRQPGKLHPAYTRMDSTLLSAFLGHPRISLPPSSAARAPRLFELREYESFSEERNLAKRDMFEAGEIDAMREIGLAPVLYGLPLSGPDLPRVIYLLSGPDRASHARHWAAFRAHPVWQRLKADPKYADTATHNTSLFLTPTPWSEI